MRTKVKAKNDSGITLVALIITIIILVILAAVTVKTLFNDRLVETAIKAGEDYKLAQGQEMNELGRIDNKLKDGINGIGSGEAGKPSGIVGAISFGELTWNNGKASVTVTKNSEDSYTIEYKVTNKDGVATREYSPIASGEIITNLSLGDLVTARLTDGTNHSKPADLNVLDKNAPQVTLKLKEGTTAKGKKATVVATVIENESGVASYKFEYKLSTEDSYNSDSNGTITTSEKTQEYEYTNLTEEVENNLRVTVTDNAGNSKIATCNVTQKPPIVPSINIVGKEVVGYSPKEGEFTTVQQEQERSGASEQILKTESQISWSLWKVSDTEIQLVSTNPTQQQLKLGNLDGFNNGTKLLDTACRQLYTDQELSREITRNNSKEYEVE